MVSTSTPHQAKHKERGGADVFMMLVLTTLIAFAGLAFDMGMVFNAHREATNVASAAARAGANQVSTEALYNQGVAKIDLGEASPAVQDSIPPGVRWIQTTLYHEKRELYVRVEVTHTPRILGFFGFDDFKIEGEGTARVQNKAS